MVHGWVWCTPPFIRGEFFLWTPFVALWSKSGGIRFPLPPASQSVGSNSFRNQERKSRLQCRYMRALPSPPPPKFPFSLRSCAGRRRRWGREGGKEETFFPPPPSFIRVLLHSLDSLPPTESTVVVWGYPSSLFAVSFKFRCLGTAAAGLGKCFWLVVGFGIRLK